MTLILSGLCTVNGLDVGTETFVARLEIVPTGSNAGAGFLAPVTSATIAGSIAVAPI
jgi:hypothetical protein